MTVSRADKLLSDHGGIWMDEWACAISRNLLWHSRMHESKDNTKYSYEVSALPAHTTRINDTVTMYIHQCIMYQVEKSTGRNRENKPYGEWVIDRIASSCKCLKKTYQYKKIKVKARTYSIVSWSEVINNVQPLVHYILQSSCISVFTTSYMTVYNWKKKKTF
jgi:hypothetical protein